MVSLDSSLSAFSMLERATSMTSLRLRFENDNLDMICKEDLFKSNKFIYEESSGVGKQTTALQQSAAWLRNSLTSVSFRL